MLSRRTLVIAAMAVALAASGAVAQTAPVRLNANTATPAQLSAAAGPLASAIQAGRPFASIVEFNSLVRSTQTEEQAKALYEKIFVPVNLNTGTREQIALIPGMTPRMIREFLEYRPYASIEVFNREMGKYVPPEEVARLRSYVTL